MSELRAAEAHARRLLSKYVEMMRLRSEHTAGTEDDPRPRLRALAGAFPGALRELDAMPIGELERRLAHLTDVSRGAPAEAWVALLSRYHELLRETLAARGAGSSVRGRPSALAIARLSVETGLDVSSIREALFDFGARLRRGRRQVTS